MKQILIITGLDEYEITATEQPAQYVFIDNTSTMKIELMNDFDIDLERIYIVSVGGGETAQKKVTEIFKDWIVDDATNTWFGTNPLVGNIQIFNYYKVNNDIMETYRSKPQLETFPLSNIDDMRMDILSNGVGQFTIDSGYYAPYNLPLKRVETPEGKLLFSKQSPIS